MTMSFRMSGTTVDKADMITVRCSASLTIPTTRQVLAASPASVDSSPSLLQAFEIAWLWAIRSFLFIHVIHKATSLAPI